MPTWLTARWPLPVWIGVVVAGGLLAALRLEVANPHGHWETSERSPEVELWRFARGQFGEAGTVIVGIQLPPSDTLGLDALVEFESWAASQPEVGSVFGPSVAKRIRQLAFVQMGLPRELLELAMILYDPKRRFGLLYLTLRSPGDQAETLELEIALIERLRSEGPARTPPGSSLHLAGKPVADVDLNELLRRDALTAGPIALLAMALVLGGLLGRRIVAPVLAVVAAAVAVAGWLGLWGSPVSTATVVCFPLTIIVGLAYGIHMEAAVSRTGDADRARREIGLPLRLALLTTVAALLTFALSPIPALRSYAYATTAGVVLGYLAAVTLVPYLVRARRKSGCQPRHLIRLPIRLFGMAARFPKWAAAVWLGFGAVTVLGLARVRVEPNNYVSFFPPDHPTPVAHRTLDRVIGGSLPTWVLATKGDIGVEDSTVEARLRHYAAVVRQDPRVGPVVTPFSATQPLGEPLEGWFRGRDPRLTRAVLSLPVQTTPEAEELIAFLDSLAAAQSDSVVRLQVTGPLPAGIPLLQALVESQVKSLVLLLVTVGMALLVVTGSWRTGLLLFIPNAMAPLAVAAAMGFGRIALDFNTVVIFSLVLGISVDDTLQLARAGAPRGQGEQRFSPARAVRRIALPVTVTSLAAAVGFGSLALSSFPVTARLGALTGLALIVAWLADLTLAPLLLRGRSANRFRKRPHPG